MFNLCEFKSQPVIVGHTYINKNRNSIFSVELKTSHRYALRFCVFSSTIKGSAYSQQQEHDPSFPPYGQVSGLAYQYALTDRQPFDPSVLP